MFKAPNSLGALLASTLAGAWRDAPPPPELSESELSRVLPPLVGSGAAALGWRKVRHSGLRSTPPAIELQQAYRYQTLQAALHERETARVFALLEAAGADALLVKGRAAAALYAEPGLRPSGDVDVCVRPAHYGRAARALEGLNIRVDLHRGFGEDEPGDFDELYARSEVLALGATAAATTARVPAPEDHLRLLCLHFLRHGAWRPLWLCDVAAALEGRGEGFDWSRLSGADGKRARWVGCAVGLARELLGARVGGTPFDDARARRLPRWLVPEVLKQWETPFPSMQAPMRYRAPMRQYLRAPGGVWRDLLSRWPNPIEATVRVGGPLNELPRLPFQLGECAARTARFVSHLAKTVRGSV